MTTSDPYIPVGVDPFYNEDSIRVWERVPGKYIATNDLNGHGYRGDLGGVVRFIERERAQRKA